MRFNTAQEAIQYELQILEAVGEIELDRLRELAAAERDGRVVVLPEPFNPDHIRGTTKKVED